MKEVLKPQRYMIILLAVLLLCAVSCHIIERNTKPPEHISEYELNMMISNRMKELKGNAALSIVVDDCGYERSYAESFFSLSTNICFAVLPDTPKAQEYASMIDGIGNEYIIHVPMEAPTQAREIRTIMLSNTEREVLEMLEDFHANLSNAVGMNNHQGSTATKDFGLMKVLAEFCKREGLFFLDSLSTAESMAYAACLSNGTAALRRDVFIDNVEDPMLIEGALKELAAVAVRQRHAVGICHFTKEETFLTLQRLITNDSLFGVRIIKLSEMVKDVNTGN